MCIFVCLLVCLCATCLQVCRNPEAGIRSLGTGGTGHCELLDVVLGTDGPMQG